MTSIIWIVAPATDPLGDTISGMAVSTDSRWSRSSPAASKAAGPSTRSGRFRSKANGPPGSRNRRLPRTTTAAPRTPSALGSAAIRGCNSPRTDGFTSVKAAASTRFRLAAAPRMAIRRLRGRAGSVAAAAVRPAIRGARPPTLSQLRRCPSRVVLGQGRDRPRRSPEAGVRRKLAGDEVPLL